jgi:cephalosporin hydroxylase
MFTWRYSESGQNHEGVAMKIDELFNYYGTDKAIYAAQYHALFKHIRERPRTLLEIGIGTMIPDAPENMVNYAGEGYSPGGSLRAWRDYFPNAEIHGIDIQPDTQFVDEARIHTHLCNSTSLDLVNRFIESQGGISFDIIIDDGSHRAIDQLTTLRNLYPHLERGGYYIIEDVGLGSRLLTELSPEVRAVCGDDLLFATWEKKAESYFVVISRRL